MHTPDKTRPWHYTSTEGKNIGPVSFDDLREAANSGLINRASGKAWCDQLSDWIPVSEIAGLYATPPPPDLTNEPIPALHVWRSAPIPAKRINTGLMTAAYWTGIGLLVIGAFLIIMANTVGMELVQHSSYDVNTGEVFDVHLRNEPNQPAMITGLFLSTIAIIPHIYFGIMAMLTVYRSWNIMPSSARRTSPGKALGFLCIPVFNYYWIFQALYGFAKDYESWRSPRAPSVSKKLFLTHCIFSCLCFIPGLFITTILVIRSMATAHNWHIEIGEDNRVQPPRLS